MLTITIFRVIIKIREILTMEEKEEIYLHTRAKNGLMVRIPLSKLEEFKRSQEHPNKEVLEEVKRKLLEDFLRIRSESKTQK